MRILYVLHCYMPDSTGGTEVHVSLLAQALSAEHDVAICYRVARPGAAEFSIEKGTFRGIPTYGIVNNYSWSNGPEGVYSCTEIEPAFEQVLDDFQPDLVHFHHLGELSTTLPSVVKRRDLITILTLHDFWVMCYRSYLMKPWDELCNGPDGGQNCSTCWAEDHASKGALLSRERLVRFRSWGVRGTFRRLGNTFQQRANSDAQNHLLLRDAHFHQVLRQFDALWAPSRFLRDRIAAWAEMPGDIDYLSNGVNPDNLAGYDAVLPNGPRLQVGFVGTVSRHKGIEVLIGALNKLVDEPLDCRIYGAPLYDDGPAFIEELKTKLVNPAVQFMGRVPNTEIGQVLSGLDVLIVPSLWWENCPMTILEAQYARRPVIATNIGGMAELVHDGENGLMFAPGDARGLAEALGRLTHDRELLLALQARITPPPVMQDVAAEVLERYQALLSERVEEQN